ncbi:hypothetical protein ACW910_22115 (plasmid) [Burkholderia ambifaria]
MPIKPEAHSHVSATWLATRARILARAGNRCEQCQVAHGDDIVRGIDKDAGTFQRLEGDGEVFAADDGRLLGYCKASEYCGNKWTRIVLTIVRLDHVREHVSDDNLKALSASAAASPRTPSNGAPMRLQPAGHAKRLATCSTSK